MKVRAIKLVLFLLAFYSAFLLGSDLWFVPIVLVGFVCAFISGSGWELYLAVPASIGCGFLVVLGLDPVLILIFIIVLGIVVCVREERKARAPKRSVPCRG